MSKPTKPPAAGDPCPSCGNELKPARVATDAEWAAFTDRENPSALPHGTDTATPKQRAELGELYRCVNPACGYKTRIPKHEGAEQPQQA